MDKRIISWRGGNNKPVTAPEKPNASQTPHARYMRRLRREGNSDWMFTRAYLFGNYGDSFADYTKLVKEAQQDFPWLETKEITITKVRESSYMKHFICINFLIPNNVRRKAGYRRSSQDFSLV